MGRVRTFRRDAHPLTLPLVNAVLRQGISPREKPRLASGGTRPMPSVCRSSRGS